MAAKPDIWMPLYIGDYQADTQHLSAAESGAYLHLLMHQWRAGYLPEASDALRRIARVDVDAWSIAWAVLKPFFDFATGAPLQLRLEELRAEWSAKKEKSAAKAKKAAEKRWSEPRGDAPSIAQAMPEPCPSSSPSSINNNRDIHGEPAPGSADEDVQTIYDAYPRKLGALKAKAAIGKAIARVVLGVGGSPKAHADAVSFLLQKTRRFAASPAGQAGEFTPHPATWFNQGRYTDDESEWLLRSQQQGGKTHASTRANASERPTAGPAAERRARSRQGIWAAGAAFGAFGGDELDGPGGSEVPPSGARSGDDEALHGGMDRPAPVFRGSNAARVIEGHFSR